MKKKITLIFAMFAALVTTATAQISADQLTIKKNGTAELTIKLTSEDVVRGVQFTLTLPTGVTVEAIGEGNVAISYTDGGNKTDYTPSNGLAVSLTDDTNGWWVAGNKVDDNYKFVLLDPSLTGLTGEHDIMKITCKANGEAISGNVEISDIHMSIASSTQDIAPDDVTLANGVTVSNVLKGDVNGNGGIDIDDPVKLLEYLADIHEGTFVEGAADVNGNGQIDIDDPVWLLENLAGLRELSRGQVQQEEEEPDWNLPDPD